MARNQPQRSGTGQDRYVIIRDRDGQRHAVARHAVSSMHEKEDGGSVLLLPGGRMIQVEDDLDTVLAWLA